MNFLVLQKDFKFFMEVSIAKRPFEHILWPQVFNFR